MKIYDITLDIKEDMMVYKNKEEKIPKLINRSNYQDGGSHYESSINMDIHTGTHMDAPLHMIEDGDTIDQTSLEKCMGKARVLDLIHISDHISSNDLKNYSIDENDIVLLKTKNSFDSQFNFDFVYLDDSGAELLTDKKIKAVGIDGLGIERSQPHYGTHKTLLSNGIPIIEGLKLSDINEGVYTFIGLPLKIKGAEGSPIRAILIEE